MQHEHSRRIVIIKYLPFADAVQLKYIIILGFDVVFLVVVAVPLDDLTKGQAEVRIVDRVQFERIEGKRIEGSAELQEHDI